MDNGVMARCIDHAGPWQQVGLRCHATPLRAQVDPELVVARTRYFTRLVCPQCNSLYDVFVGSAPSVKDFESVGTYADDDFRDRVVFVGCAGYLGKAIHVDFSEIHDWQDLDVDHNSDQFIQQSQMPRKFEQDDDSEAFGYVEHEWFGPWGSATRDGKLVAVVNGRRRYVQEIEMISFGHVMHILAMFRMSHPASAITTRYSSLMRSVNDDYRVPSVMFRRFLISKGIRDLKE